MAAQVLPEVAELTTRGPGVHRVTLALHPETLGEVKVVLTMRGGEVQVTLAAGQEARGALRESMPELQRMLDGTGVRDAHVALRELASSAPSASSAAASYAGNGGAPGHGQPGPHGNPGATADGQTLGADADGDAAGTHDQHDGRAGTRGSGQTTDGSPDGPTAREVATGARHARAAGVDLVM